MFVFFYFCSLVTKESKEKLSVNFLYEPPPGMKKEREINHYPIFFMGNQNSNLSGTGDKVLPVNIIVVLMRTSVTNLLGLLLQMLFVTNVINGDT